MYENPILAHQRGFATNPGELQAVLVCNSVPAVRSKRSRGGFGTCTLPVRPMLIVAEWVVPWYTQSTLRLWDCSPDC